MAIIKEFTGYSNCITYLMEENKVLFVRKTGVGIHRNLERLRVLKNAGVSVPEVYDKGHLHFDMEYIPGLDMKTYLLYNNPNALIDFLSKFLSMLNPKEVVHSKEYQDIIREKISYIDDPYWRERLPFTVDEFHPPDMKWYDLQTNFYHGDLTLENIIFNRENNKFYFIDPVTIEYNCYRFDRAKLSQDLICKWFIRNERIYIDSKLAEIEKEVGLNNPDKEKYIILMLLRVLPYAHVKSKDDEKFLLERIRELWLSRK